MCRGAYNHLVSCQSYEKVRGNWFLSRFFASQIWLTRYKRHGDGGNVLFRRVGRSIGLAERTGNGKRAHARAMPTQSHVFQAFSAIAAVAFTAVSGFAIATMLDRSAANANESSATAEQDASKMSADKPKFDWETARVEFGAESIVIKKPLFEIAMPNTMATGGSVADPELIYAILRPAFRALDGVSVNKIEIIDGVVNIREGETQTHQLTKLNAEFAVKSAAGLTRGKGEFELRGEILSFETAIAKPDDTNPQGDIPLRLTVSGAGLNASFEGVAKRDTNARLEGTVDVTVKDIRKLATWAGFSLSEGAGLDTFRTQGKMAWTAGLFDMSKGLFTLDDNEASGVLSLDLRNKRASVEGTLALDRLDLSDYFTQKDADGAEQSTVLGTLMPSLKTETQLQVPILRDFDADVRVSVKEIRAGALRTGAGAMTLTLRSGNLLADIAELRMFDGAIVGQLEFNANNPEVQISARGLLDNIEAGDAMRWVTEVPTIRGRARVTANVSSKGHTLSQLMRAMKGDARLSMLDGGAFRIDVDGLMQKASDAPLQGWDEANDQETEFGTLEARLLLDNARISTRGLRADRDSTRIVAYGTINLAEQNVSVRMSVVDKPSNTNGTPDAYESGPTLTMQGPWDEPSIALEKQARSALPSLIKPADDRVFAKSSVK